jgi:hypothetical protein
MTPREIDAEVRRRMHKLNNNYALRVDKNIDEFTRSLKRATDTSKLLYTIASLLWGLFSWFDMWYGVSSTWSGWIIAKAAQFAFTIAMLMHTAVFARYKLFQQPSTRYHLTNISRAFPAKSYRVKTQWFDVWSRL